MRVCPFKILWPKKYFYIFTVNMYDSETKKVDGDCYIAYNFW